MWEEMSGEGEHLEKYSQDFTDMDEKEAQIFSISTGDYQEIMSLNV